MTTYLNRTTKSLRTRRVATSIATFRNGANLTSRLVKYAVATKAIVQSYGFERLYLIFDKIRIEWETTQKSAVSSSTVDRRQIASGLAVFSY